MDYNIVRIWKIDWMKRRVLLPEEEDNPLYTEVGPPWMETGWIRTCYSCGYEVWETISMPDGCIKCRWDSTAVEGRQPNWLEKLVHAWRADHKFSPAMAAKEARTDATLTYREHPPYVDLPPLPTGEERGEER